MSNIAEFHHVAMSYKKLTSSSALVSTYLDGQRRDSVVVNSLLQYDNTPNFYIGTNRDGRAIGGPGVREFPGIIDEIRISKVALEPNQFGSGQLTVSRSSINFGLVEVSHSASQNITLANTSFTQSLHIDSIIITDLYFDVDQTPFDLAPLSNRALEITYAPITKQIDTGSIIIYASDPAVSRTVYLSGQGFAVDTAPIIKSVHDIPDDEGKQVRVSWYASIYDSQTESLTVGEYSVWRRIDGSLSRQEQRGALGATGLRGSVLRTMTINGELWDYVVTVPAVRFDQYAFVAPTLVNATQFGLKWSVFRVAGHTTSGDFFFSDPDSGYSYNNNFPPPPPFLQAIVHSNRVSLKWNPSPAPDVQTYNVYRSTSPSVVSSVFSRIASTSSQTFEDSTGTPDSTYYYTVTAVDVDWNEGAQSNNTPGMKITSVDNNGLSIPREYMLSQNYPNPFNPSTELMYGIPSVSHVQLVVYNVLGQAVARLIDEIIEPGFHRVQWTSLDASGVYFYRFEATSVTDPSQSLSKTGKMMLLK